MKKRFLALLLALGMCITPAAAAESGESNWPSQFRDSETGLWGLRGEDGIILPAEYAFIFSFSDDGYAVVRKDRYLDSGEWKDDYGLIDWKGNFILPLGEYSYIEMGAEGIATVGNEEGLYAYLRVSDRTPVTDFCFRGAEKFYRIGVCEKLIGGEERYGAVNAQGETVIPFEYDQLLTMTSGFLDMILAVKGGHYGAFTYDGTLLRRCIYPGVEALQRSLSLPAQMTEEEEMAALIAASQTWELIQDKEGLWGYHIPQGDAAQDPGWAIRPLYAAAQPFDESGYAKITDRDGRNGYIDQSGDYSFTGKNPLSFTDVPAGSWFEEGVKTCAEKGIMVGTGEGTFSPDGVLTSAECLTLAMRLRLLRAGGAGALLKAPEDWGKVELTLSDGTTFTTYGQRDENFFYTRFDRPTAEDPYADFWAMAVLVPGETDEERQTWAEAHQGNAFVTVNGKRYNGSVAVDTDEYGPQFSTRYLLRFVFDEPEDGGLDLFDLFLATRPGPDKWYRDAVYTAETWGLRDADGFSSMISLLYDPPGSTDRDTFSRALAVAAGDLEKRFDIESIPGLRRGEDSANESIFSLYEAGVLTGTDEYGAFSPGEKLTRAQAAVMVARVLDPEQRMTAPPKTDGGYAAAMAELRNRWGHLDEELLETDYCTIMVYDSAGIMSRSTGVITLIYKAGAIPGEGTVITLPHARVQYPVYTYPADAMTLSEDGKTLTYTYYRPEDIVGWVEGVNEGEVLEKAGQVTYTVDLPTGEVIETFSPLNYDGAMTHVTRKRIKTTSENSVDREVVETLENEACTAVLTKGKDKYDKTYDDYILSLVYKPGSALGDGVIKRLVLPSTVYSRGYKPTDRAPDRMRFSDDGSKFIYSYQFTDRLAYTDYAGEEIVLHEAGAYVYTVDVATGELSVELMDPYDYALWEVFAADQFQLDRQIETDLCSIVLGTFRAANIPRTCVALVYKEGSPLGAGAKRFLPTQGGTTVHDSTLPHALSVSEDGGTLTYSYQFEEPAYSWDNRLVHKAGTFTYTVDLLTGEYEEAYQEP